jgi:thiol-disulfide isomerase/thioredoxin
MAPSGPAPLALDLYTKPDCPLCDEACDALARVRARLSGVPLVVRSRDIRTDPAWSAAYGNLIPVLEMDGERLCVYRVDERQLAKRLAEAWTARVNEIAEAAT